MKPPWGLSHVDNGRLSPATLELIVICLVAAHIILVSSARGLWIALFVQNKGLSTTGVGWLMSGELALCAVGTLLAAAWGQRLGPRLGAILGLSLAIVANLISIQLGPQAVIAGRLLAGFGNGVASAYMMLIISRRTDATRIFALTTGITLIEGIGFGLLLRLFVGAEGLARLFIVTAGLGAVAAIAASLWLPRTLPAAQTKRQTGPLSFPALLACIGMTSIGVGASAFGPYWIVIANNLGFGAEELGRVAAFATPITLLGPLAASRIADRIGPIKPIIICLSLIAGSWLVQVRAPSVEVLGVCSAVGGVASGFVAAYLMTLIKLLEPTGRTLAATGAFSLLGSALGPAIGGAALGFMQVESVATVGAGFVVLAIVLLLAAAHFGGLLGRRPDIVVAGSLPVNQIAPGD